jgi:hypothetical protein
MNMVIQGRKHKNSLPDDVKHNVSSLNQAYVKLWWELDTHPPVLDVTYSLRDKFPREKTLEAFLNDLIHDLSETPRTRSHLTAARERIVKRARYLAVSALDFQPDQLDVIERNHFAETAVEFVEKSRQFDPQISAEDIFQGGRNAWSMNLLQYVMGRPVEVTPAILAYSLMYPYSDNYLDDPALSQATKMNFSQRFGQRLLDSSVQPANTVEEKIFDLVAMVEGQYSHSEFPQVWDSLIAIHAAQTRSLGLLNRPISPYEGADVLDISFEKGGTAVLADGYLVAGELTVAQQDFLYGYGVFTQLMDDQEDIQQDWESGQTTIFSQTARAWPLDAVTNRMFSLGHVVLDKMDCFDAPGLEDFRSLLRRAIDLLLVDAAGRHYRFYTRPYLKQIETYLPYRYSFMRRLHHRMAKRNLSLGTLIGVFSEVA